MVSDGDIDQFDQSVFEEAMRRLGWLSSFSRQAILSRHLLRCLQEFDVIDDILAKAPERYLLDCFRAAITALTGVTRETKVFSAPYEPSNRPETHFIAFSRKERIFEVSVSAGTSSFVFHYPNGGGFGLDSGSGLDDQDYLLIQEIQTLAAGVGITTKGIADDRVARLRDEPLWGHFRSDYLTAFEEIFKVWDAIHPQVSSFWKRWLDGIISGKPLNWDLQRKVALLPEGIWKKGPISVANAIAEIEAQMLTAVAPQLVRDVASSAFIIEAETPLDDELLNYIKERVGGALKTALESSGNNGFDEKCEEALAIAQALRSTNPSAVAGLLNDASLMFQKNLGDRYPADGALISLQNAAFLSAEEICETDEVARQRCLRAAKLHLRENPEPIDPTELQEFTDEVALEATGEARDIIKEDGRAIAIGKRVGRFVRARFVNYAATIVQWIDKTKKGVGRAEWLWKMVRKLLDAFDDRPPQA